MKCIKESNISILLNMTKEYLEGKIDPITYYLDFPYEVEIRYKELVKENREMAEMIFDCLVEEGASLYSDLSDEELKQLIQKQYDNIIGNL
jgi:hypothetical protein